MLQTAPHSLRHTSCTSTRPQYAPQAPERTELRPVRDEPPHHQGPTAQTSILWTEGHHAPPPRRAFLLRSRCPQVARRSEGSPARKGGARSGPWSLCHSRRPSGERSEAERVRCSRGLGGIEDAPLRDASTIVGILSPSKRVRTTEKIARNAAAIYFGGGGAGSVPRASASPKKALRFL